MPPQFDCRACRNKRSAASAIWLKSSAPRRCPSPRAAIASRRSRETTSGPSRSNRSRANPSQNDSSSLLDTDWAPPRSGPSQITPGGGLRRECLPNRDVLGGVSSRADAPMSLKYNLNCKNPDSLRQVAHQSTRLEAAKGAPDQINKGRQSTQVNRFKLPYWRLAPGHEGRFPPAKLNGRYRFRKRSVAVSDLSTRTFGAGSKLLRHRGRRQSGDRERALTGCHRVWVGNHPSNRNRSARSHKFDRPPGRRVQGTDGIATEVSTKRPNYLLSVRRPGRTLLLRPGLSLLQRAPSGVSRATVGGHFLQRCQGPLVRN
jgi:hypothetical protein